MDTAGTIGTPASIAVLTYPLRPLKSMTFSDPVGRDVAGAPEDPGRHAREEDVVTERVDGAVVAELFVEVDAEDRDVHREHATGVVADHQCAPGREGLQAVPLGPEGGLQDRPHHAHQALGQARVEFVDVPDVRVIAVGHVPPSRLRRGHLAASSLSMVATTGGVPGAVPWPTSQPWPEPQGCTG